MKQEGVTGRNVQPILTHNGIIRRGRGKAERNGEGGNSASSCELRNSTNLNHLTNGSMARIKVFSTANSFTSMS